MNKATAQELRQMLRDNDNLFGSYNHVEMSNESLRVELLTMPACTLHYTIVGDCLMIFSKPSQQ